MLGVMLLALGLTGLTGPGSAPAADKDEDLQARLLRLNNITGDDALLGAIRTLEKDPAGTKKLLAAARDLLKAKKKEEPLNVNATIILAQAALALKDYDTSELFLRLNVDQARKLESPKKIIRGYLVLIQMLMESKKFDEAEKVYKEFQELEVNEEVDRAKDRLRRTMALILARQGQVDKAMDFVDKILKEDQDNGRENPLNMELKAQVLREAGKLDEAVGIYGKVITAIQKNRRLPKEAKEELLDQLNYKLSGLYVDMKQIDKAAGLLQKLLDKDPDNSTYANDLGFILADHDMKLDEAEKLIRQAITKDREERKKLFKENPDLPAELDKDNPAYLDSLGWVLFKKKQYAEAKKFLQEALEQEEGRHLEIYDHLGDCLIKLEDKKGAIEAWRKGVEIASESRRDKQRKADVEKKIKDAEK
jgi:tetratricopeptide (TPR) repeat protein